MSFDEFKESPNSEKITLVWIEPFNRIFNFTSEGGNLYSKVVDFYTIGLADDGVDLIEVSTLGAVVSGSFFFDKPEKKVYFNLLDDSDPIDSFITGKFRLHFSTNGVSLPYNLVDGDSEVEYIPIVDKASKIKQEVDNVDQTGTALSSATNVSFINEKNGFFQKWFQILYWQNKEIRIFSWNTKLKPSEAKAIFKGDIESKSFSESRVTFRAKDFITRFKQEVDQPIYTTSDGDLQDSILGKPKRRIYGRVNGLRLQSVENILGGFDLSGLYSGTIDTKTIIRDSGGDLLNEVSQGDKLVVTVSGEDFDFTVDTADVNTITVAEDLDVSFSGATLKLEPIVSPRSKNRNQIIAHHTLREPSTTITESINFNRFRVADVSDIFPDDRITVDGVDAVVDSISTDVIITKTNLPTLPAFGNAVIKEPVSSVTYLGIVLTPTRDYTITNSSPSKIVLDSLMEFNIAPTRVAKDLTFTNSDATVTGTNLRDRYKTRDWIKPNNAFYDTWYEILSVEESAIELRTSFSDATITSESLLRSPNYVSDDSIIVVNTLGKTFSDGSWIKTGSDVVKDLMIEADLSGELNTISFDDANDELSPIMSIALPLDFGNSSKPSIKSVFDIVGKSILSSIHNNSDLLIDYDILNPKKPDNAREIFDDDIISWSVRADGKNISDVIKMKYRHFDSDSLTSDNGSKTIEENSEIVQNLGGISNTTEIDSYVYDDDDASIISQRQRLLREFASASILIKAKLDFIDGNLNEVVYFNLDRLFDRRGAGDLPTQIGLLQSISKSPDGVDIVVNDLSGLYNRICNITLDTALDHSSATIREKTFNGYITADDGLVSGDEKTFQTNLIG